MLSLPAVGSGEAGTKYIIRAEAQGSQAGDTNCKFLQLTQDKGNTRYQSGGSAAVSNDTTANNQCWKR